MMRNANRVITVMLLAAAFFFTGSGWIQGSTAFAEDGVTDPVVLQIYYDNEQLAEYTMGDLESIAQEEGSKEYDFSGMNMYPTPELNENVTGPTVKGLIDDALGKATIEGVPSGTDQLEEDQLIDLRDGANSYSAVFTAGQLFSETRFCFPNIMNEVRRNGASPQQVSYEGNTEVPAIISLYESDDPNKAGRLLIGQITPHDQNKPDWVQGMVVEPESGKASIPGVIVIRTDKAEKLKAVTKTDALEGGKIIFGKGITFDRAVNDYKADGGKRYWIYYTTDGTEPTRDSAIYNYNGNAFGTSYEKFNKPLVTKDNAEFTLKIKVYGNGRLESETSEFAIRGIELASPKTISMGSTTYSSATIKWTNVFGAEGYEVYRKTAAQENYALLKRFEGSGTLFMRDGSLLTGTKYYYKVRAFARVEDGSTNYSPFTSYVKAAPALIRPALKKVSIKKKTATVKWNKVTGAGGYQIWRAEKKKTGKYKLIKTLKSGKTLSWKNKKLKKGKKYFYKIRAYRVVKGKKVFSSYSAVKSIKVK